MESFNLIKKKWEYGAYNLKDIVKLVEKNIINEQQFFEITRYYYNSISLNK